MSRKALLVVLVLTFVLALGVAGGCKKDTESGSESSTATLPEGFPTDVPVYEGTIVDSKQTGAEGGDAYTVSITAPEPGADVVEWYEAELVSEGWMVATATLPNDGGNVVSGNKDGQSVTVTVTEGGEGSDLTIEVGTAD